MKINSFGLRRGVFTACTGPRAHMTARRETLLQVTDVFTDFSASFVTESSSGHDSPSEKCWVALQRDDPHTRGQNGDGSDVPKGGWNDLEETGSAEGEELDHVENWSYCYEGSGWPVTTAAAIEAEYLPKGGLNGCGLALDGRPQAFVVFISVFGCHGSRCRLVRWDRIVFGCWTVEEKCQWINVLILILSPDSGLSAEASGTCVGHSSIGQGWTAQVRVWTHRWVCVACGAAFSLHVVINRVRFVFL